MAICTQLKTEFVQQLAQKSSDKLFNYSLTISFQVMLEQRISSWTIGNSGIKSIKIQEKNEKWKKIVGGIEFQTISTSVHSWTMWKTEKSREWKMTTTKIAQKTWNSTES